MFALVAYAMTAPLTAMAASQPASSSSPAPTLSAPQAAAVAEAQDRGSRMVAYDRAAWRASDVFQKDAGARLDTLIAKGLTGYVVEPGDGDALLVSFFGRKDGRVFALARYVVAGGGVTGGLEEDMPALSPLGLRLADARDQALLAMGKPGHGMCSRSPPNTLVLPGGDGALSAYVLSSTQDASTFPAGGHYRFDFDAAGKMVGERRFMMSCLQVSTRTKDGVKPQVMFMTHLLDPQPTEIHTFISRTVPIDLMVLTMGNHQLWRVSDGVITPLGAMPDTGNGRRIGK
jgi:hypothetical protein